MQLFRVGSLGGEVEEHRRRCQWASGRVGEWATGLRTHFTSVMTGRSCSERNHGVHGSLPEVEKCRPGLTIGLTGLDMARHPYEGRPRVSSSAARCSSQTRMQHRPIIQHAVQTLRSRNGTQRQVSADLLSTRCDEFEKAQRSCSRPYRPHRSSGISKTLSM